jgi:enterobacterial common antigen flippase
MTAEKNTYGQILRSSSIVGGAQAANYLIGFARVKLVAVLLGPTGVGLVGLYISATGLVGAVSGLGVGSSAVREIVRAYSQGDPQEAACTVIILRRVCWATGFFGWMLAVVFREPISRAISSSSEHAGAIAVLGATLLFSAVSGGQLALLQGLRRIGDLARANVTGAALGSVVTVAIYLTLGSAGIVPALIAAGFVTLACSFWYARRVPVSRSSVSFGETIIGARRLLGLGLAFMWSAVLVAGIDLLIRAIIARKFGIEGAGIYQASWALSGMFASFVLSAMGADFYPRLTATIHDRALAARTVNEQTEIGVLLALPGLLTAMTWAPLAIKLLYTPQFLPAADLLPWMALGVFGRVISWPVGFLQLALGASRWFAATETIFVGLWAALTYSMCEAFGIIGSAYAFALTYALYTAGMLWVARVLIDFSWSTGTLRLILASATFVGVAYAARFLWSESATLIAGSAVTLVSAAFCLHSLYHRLDRDGNHMVTAIFNKVQALNPIKRG